MILYLTEKQKDQKIKDLTQTIKDTELLLRSERDLNKSLSERVKILEFQISELSKINDTFCAKIIKLREQLNNYL